MMRKITDSQYFIRLYLYCFTFQALLKSVFPTLSHTELSLFRRLYTLVLETRFFLKAIYIKLFRIHVTRESFFGYTMEFPNYLEFTPLFLSRYSAFRSIN